MGDKEYIREAGLIATGGGRRDVARGLFYKASRSYVFILEIGNYLLSCTPKYKAIRMKISDKLICW